MPHTDTPDDPLHTEGPARPAVDTRAGRSLGPLLLSPGTSRGNVAAYYWLAFTSIMIFTFVPALQASLLTVVLGIPEQDQGQVTGLLGVVAEIVLIVVVFTSGAISDRIGRRPIAVAGYATMALGIGLTPFVGTVLSLVMARAVAGVGIAMITGMITTVVTDYIQDRTRGVANGLLGVCNGFGAIVTFLVLVQLPDRFAQSGMTDVAALQTTYLLVSGIALGTALIMRLGLRPGRAVVTENRPSLRALLGIGLTAGRRPGLTLSYAAAFVGRADLALVGAFLILWAVQYGERELGLSSTEALARGGILVAVTNGMALLSAPLTGMLADRIGRVDAVLVTMGIAATAYISTLLIDNPFTPLGYVIAALIGIAQVATVISSQVLVAEQAPASIRGSVIGVFGLCGGIGIMVALGVGGVLFDRVRPAAPFVMFGMFALMVVALGLALRGRIPRGEVDDDVVVAPVAPSPEGQPTPRR